MKISKLGNHLKRVRWSVDRFSDLVHERRRSVAQESRALADVYDSAGFESHQASAGCVGSDRVIGKHDLSEWTGSAVERAVAFHGHNAVRDNEVDWNSGAQIKDALLDPLPMEDVLRPST
jgi:hypothetical protein